MGVLARAFRPRQVVSSASGDGLERAVRWLGGGPSASGVSVTDETALRCAAVYGCVRVAAEDVAKLPLILYRRRPDGGRDRATDHPLYSLLHDSPNEWLSSFDFRQTLQGHRELRGNAFAHIVRVRGQVRELLPLHPDRVTVRQADDWTVTYEVRERGGGTETYPARDILHLRGLSSDGLAGLSTLSVARETVGLSIASERHAARLFGNGARPGGVLQTDKKVDRETKRSMAEDWERMYGGENAGKTAILDMGLTWQALGMTSEDAQFIELRKFSVPDICRFFRIAPHKVMDLERSTFSNIEHQEISHYTDALLPRTTGWEQEINRKLLTREERGTLFVEHLYDGVLRGDVKARSEAYKTGVLTGYLTRNEVRRRENLNPLDGLDEPLTPLNMVPAGEEPTE